MLNERIARAYHDWLVADYPQLYGAPMPDTDPKPPWGSKGAINRAGTAIRNGTLSDANRAALDAWRAAHKHVLNSFQSILRNRTRRNPKQQKNFVAQRLKRRITIIDKLHREPAMQLARMDDVAGCRLIFPSIATLTKVRDGMHEARFKHARKNNEDKYDYIKHPKKTGYRGIHDIYEYSSQSKEGKPFSGLLIELQYRTYYQHAWATAVEVVTRITENQPKFDKGDERYKEFFRLASEMIARIFEDTTSCYPDITDAELVRRFNEIDGEIHLMGLLRSLNEIHDEGRAGNVILQFSGDKLTMHPVKNIVRATEQYFQLEKANPGDDIVLVHADTFDEIRNAYRNYFSDTDQFVAYVAQAIQDLGGAEVN
jgi:putative GTP pyrophosphokinase